MLWRWSLRILALSVVLVVAQRRFSPSEIKAEFYADLGPNEVDLADYPWTQRSNYEVFAKTCSQCHKLARAINSPYISRNDWGNYVRLMHVIKKGETGKSWPNGDA